MGFVQGGTVIHDGDNLAVRGAIPAGIAAQGQVIWRASLWRFLTSAIFYVGTPATIDTTTAKLIVVTVSTYVTNAVLSDNLGNIWTQLAPVAARANLQVWYCIAPQTSTTHVFSIVNGSYLSAIVTAFSCAKGIAFNQSTTGAISSNSTTVAIASLTPSADNSLLVTGVANGFDVYSVDSGFAITQTVASIPATRFGNASAYLVQNSSAAIAPIWTIQDSAYPGAAAALLSFIPSP